MGWLCWKAVAFVLLWPCVYSPLSKAAVLWIHSFSPNTDTELENYYDFFFFLQTKTEAQKGCLAQDHTVINNSQSWLQQLVPESVFMCQLFGLLFNGQDVFQFSSVQFSHSVVSDSLRPHELQHSRSPCPSPTPRVHPNSCPLSRWCHPAISSSVIPFSSCPQSLPASEFFPMSQLFAWGGQTIGVSALASVLPKNTQDWSPLEWTGWIS